MLASIKNKSWFRLFGAALLVLGMGVGVVFLFPEVTQAQGVGEDDLGMEYGEATGLPGTDPRVVIARIIQVVLGFLGVIALSLIVYGGFLWMTSAGNPEKIEKAKKVLKNAIIGLIIILASFGITTFVLNKMLGATGSGGQTGDESNQRTRNLGALGSCIVRSVYPAPQQEEVPRNTSIMITFKEEIDPTTICDDANGNGECDGEDIIIDDEDDDQRIRIYKVKDGDGNYIEDVRVDQTSDGKTFVFTPRDYLGSPSEYLWYGVYLSNDIKKTNGKGAFNTCQQDYFEWQFQVSNELDLTPPKVDTIFPPPDDDRDDEETISNLSFATGEIVVNNNPEFYEPASLESVTAAPGSSDDTDVQVDSNCDHDGILRLAVESDGVTATLENVDQGSGLGSSEFQGDTVSFDGILDFTVNGSYDAGDSWDIEVNGRQKAESLSVNSDAYIFVDESEKANEIQVENNIDGTASNIATILDGRDDLMASSSGNVVNIKAAQGGSDGNDITIQAEDHNDDNDLTISSLSGGEDKEEVVNVNDREDKPKNSIIQVNFNEAVNPVTISGPADSVSDHIKVSNADSGAGGEGSACSENSDCLSFDCDDSSGQCVNDHLAGEFITSNQYETVEFQSDNRCGTNACGEDIYCLPENSNIKVEMEAARLDGCTNDCSARSPYNDCQPVSGSVDGETCVDDQGTATSSDDINYPMANLPLDGVADAANNSLDGNSVRKAEGPVSYYNENVEDESEGDSYKWSFWTSDELRIEPPEILSTSPISRGRTDDLVRPVEVEFDVLMQSGSLTSGETDIDTGDKVTTHKLVNLWNFSGSAVGYWISKEDIEDEPPMDGYPNKTMALIEHSMFSESITYRAQVGSGVKDIYQNCYKPSEGPACDNISDTAPSCCDEAAVSAGSCD